MSPLKIIKEASRKKVSIIAITDHNSAENVKPVIKAAKNFNIYVIPGMEITSVEEVHIIALFESVADSASMQKIIFDHLQPGENDEDLFGLQVVANEYDEVEGFNKRLLIGSTSLTVNEVVDAIHRFNGLAIAAHIDRENYSIIAQLGFIPDDLDFDAVEISRRLTLPEAKHKYKEYNRFPFITSSDAHELDVLGVFTTRLLIEKPNINELKMAFKGKNGRKILMDNDG